jgi:hypothetical protein
MFYKSREFPEQLSTALGVSLLHYILNVEVVELHVV